jgi:sensor c-di-GMP phosphodiesterase-like protein
LIEQVEREKRRQLWFQVLLGLVASVVISATFIVQARDRYYEEIKKQPPTSPYKNQIAALDRARGDITSLLAFIDRQKTETQNRETALNELKARADQLRPFVEADEKTVTAILDAEARRREATVWFVRVISFGLGILSSLVASWLFQRESRKRASEAWEDDDSS